MFCGDILVEVAHAAEGLASVQGLDDLGGLQIAVRQMTPEREHTQTIISDLAANFPGLGIAAGRKHPTKQKVFSPWASAQVPGGRPK